MRHLIFVSLVHSTIDKKYFDKLDSQIKNMIGMPFVIVFVIKWSF